MGVLHSAFVAGQWYCLSRERYVGGGGGEEVGQQGDGQAQIVQIEDVGVGGLADGERARATGGLERRGAVSITACASATRVCCACCFLPKQKGVKRGLASH